MKQEAIWKMNANIFDTKMPKFYSKNICKISPSSKFYDEISFDEQIMKGKTSTYQYLTDTDKLKNNELKMG
jgi:hypothetical protein